MPNSARTRTIVTKDELSLALRIEEAAMTLLRDSAETFDSGQEELARREYDSGMTLLNEALAMRRDFISRVGDAPGVAVSMIA